MDDFFEAADLWDADEWLPDPDSEPDPDEESSSEPESDELPEEESVKIQIIYKLITKQYYKQICIFFKINKNVFILLCMYY